MKLKVDQKKFAEWQERRTRIEIRRRSPHGAILRGVIKDFDSKSLVVYDGVEESLVYLEDVSTVKPQKPESDRFSS